MKGKPASAKAWALYRKLKALAERGVDGEREAARSKLARLEARHDFSAPAGPQHPTLFSGRFARSSTARPVYSFRRSETALASSVKWAIESGTRVHCLHRGEELLAEATPATVRRLSRIADQITQSFRVLLERFSALEGMSAADRNAFLMGLYDGMMNETRDPGQRLPGQTHFPKRRKAKTVPNRPAGVQAHPYSIAVGLGRQIRIEAPMEQIAAELEAAAPGLLAR
jgi:hypothetical protein